MFVSKPADCKTLIDKLKACDENQLLEELKNIKSWNCGKVLSLFRPTRFSLFSLISANFITGSTF